VFVSDASGRVLVTVVAKLGELRTPDELVAGGIVTVEPVIDVALEVEMEVEIEVVDVDEEEVPTVVVETVFVEEVTTVVAEDVDVGEGELTVVVVDVVVKERDVLVLVPVWVVVSVVVPGAVVEVERVTEDDETAAHSALIN